MVRFQIVGWAVQISGSISRVAVISYKASRRPPAAVGCAPADIPGPAVRGTLQHDTPFPPDLYDNAKMSSEKDLEVGRAPSRTGTNNTDQDSKEKDLEAAAASSQTSTSNKEVSDSEADGIDWTPEEERKLVRKSVQHFTLLDMDKN